MRASPGLFIRVSLSKDKVPEPNHYFIYYTCEVRVKRKRSAFGRIYPHPVAVAPFPPIKESGQVRVPGWSRQLGSSPLSTFVAQGTSALTATRRRDCGRRSRPQTRSTSRTMGLPWAPVCSRPAPSQRTDARTSRAKGGSGQETVPVAAGSVNRHRLLQV